MKEFTIGKNDAGQRLDKYLSKSLPLLPQSLMYKAIRKKKIKVNRARADISQKLCEGDTLQLFLPDDLLSDNGEAKAEPYRTITPHIDIIYEDEEIILIDKKPGMAVHGGDDSAGGGSRIDERDTLINNVLAYLWREGKYDPDTERSFTPALCNRIDRNTGGIVIAAKTAEALRRINEEIRAGEVTKRYLCAVHGYMEKKRGRLIGWMEKDAQHGIVHVHFGERKTPNGRTMITDYRVLAEERELSLLEVTLITGRTHQIRAQMQAAGHPLLGEGKYGINREDRARGYSHQALYAYKLSLEGKDYERPSDPEHIPFLREFKEYRGAYEPTAAAAETAGQGSMDKASNVSQSKRSVRAAAETHPEKNSSFKGSDNAVTHKHSADSKRRKNSTRPKSAVRPKTKQPTAKSRTKQKRG